MFVWHGCVGLDENVYKRAPCAVPRKEEKKRGTKGSGVRGELGVL